MLVWYVLFVGVSFLFYKFLIVICFLFACALIKKHRYWPVMIKGDAICEYVEEKEVDDIDCVEGIILGFQYNIWCIEEPNYVMKMMVT